MFPTTVVLPRGASPSPLVLRGEPAFTGCSPKRHWPGPHGAARSPSVIGEGVRRHRRRAEVISCAPEDLTCSQANALQRWPGCSRCLRATARSTRRDRRVGSRHRRSRLPRDRRRRPAWDQLDLPGRRPPRRGARGGGAAASGDLHRLVVERRAGRGRPDGRGVEGAARRRADPRAAGRQHGRERGPLAGARADDRGRLRGRARLLDPALPARALPLRPPLPPLRLRDSLSLRLPAAPVAAARPPRAVVDHPDGAGPAPRAAPAGRAGPD